MRFIEVIIDLSIKVFGLVCYATQLTDSTVRSVVAMVTYNCTASISDNIKSTDRCRE